MLAAALLFLAPGTTAQEPPPPPEQREEPAVVERGKSVPAMPMVQPLFDPERTYEGRDWIDRVARTLEPGTVVPFTQSLKLMGMVGGPDAEPEVFRVERKGRLIFGGELGVRVESSKEMVGLPMLAGASTEVFVRKGEVLFVDDDDPLAAILGASGPGSIAAEQALALAEEGPMPATALAMLDPNPAYRDPLALLKKLVYASKVPVVSTEDGAVVLEGPAAAGLAMGTPGNAGATAGPRIEVVLEMLSGRPRSLVVGDPEDPDFVMRFESYEQLEELDPAWFEVGGGRELRDLEKEIREHMAQVEAMAGQVLQGHDEF